MAIDFRKMALISLYFYIATLYSLAYNTSLNLISKGLFIVTIGLFCLHLITNPSINKGKIYGFFLCYTLYSTISCFWSPDFNIAFSRNLTLYQILALVFMIYNLIETEEELNSVFQSIFWGTMVMCGQTVLTYGLGNVISMMMRGVRIGSEINQANAFGYYCAVAFLVAMYNVLYRKKRIFLLFAIVPLVFSFASGSRKSILVVIAATALVFALKNGKIRISQIMVALGACILLFVLLYNVEALQPFFKRFTAMLELFDSGDLGSGDNSIAKRVDMIRFGLELFKENILFGYGTEQYNVLYQMEFGEMRPAHNNYIQSLVSFGIIGTAVFYGMYIYIAKVIYKSIIKKNVTAVLILVITVTELVNQLTAGAFLNKFTYIYLTLAFVFCNMAENKRIYVKEENQIERK